MPTTEVLLAVRHVIDEAPFTLVDLADSAGISYDAIRSWSVGRREPRPATVQKLAAGLRKKADELERLARELDEARP